MRLNNLYNFKNPVKHFLNIDNIKLPEDIASFEIKKICWAEPFNFRVKKQDDKYRTLKMPNILNFARAYEHFKDLPNFEGIKYIDPLHKRLSANIATGDFISGEYEIQQEKDFNRLCIYDVLLKMDIKEYYGRIYTHDIDFQGHNEQFLTNMNLGATNGLIMGNYLSLYFAELNLKSISNDIEREITGLDIDCEFSYFSDDFYFFCNKSDIEKVVKIFDKILEKYKLERNDAKKEVWTYETFNNYNLVARYWKKVIAHCNVRVNKEKEDNKLYFINQIVYRLSKLEDDKLKRVFINNLFKTRYFREMNLEAYQVMDYDYHQLCFILKFSPEAMLYAVDKFSEMSGFDNNKLLKFLKVRFREALQQTFNEEQLYFYYAIKILGFTDILVETKEAVLNSENQILISYYLKDGVFDQGDIEILKENSDKNHWFQNYHLILYSVDLLADIENSIVKYLVPKQAMEPRRDHQKQTYINFYKENIVLGNSMIRDISGVCAEIIDYLTLRIEESESAFATSDEEELIILEDLIRSLEE